MSDTTLSQQVNDAKTAASAAVLLYRMGFTPIKVVGKNPAGGEGKGWQTRTYKSEEAVRLHFADWNGEQEVSEPVVENGKTVNKKVMRHRNVGVLCDGFCMFGANSTKAVDAFRAVMPFYDATLARMGNNPYACAIFKRTDPQEPFWTGQKILTVEEKPVTLADIWGDHTQFVAWGVHPSGARYKFVNTKEILPMTTAALKGILKEVMVHLGAGYRLKIQEKAQPKKEQAQENNIFKLVKKSVRMSSILGTTDTRVVCPLHTQTTQNPAAVIYEDSEGDTLYCHSCGKIVDVIQMYAQQKNLKQIEAARSLAKEYTIEIPKKERMRDSISELEKEKLFGADMYESPSLKEPPCDGYRSMLEESIAVYQLQNDGQSFRYIARKENSLELYDFKLRWLTTIDNDGKEKKFPQWFRNVEILAMVGIGIKTFARSYANDSLYAIGTLSDGVCFEKLVKDIPKLLIDEGRTTTTEYKIKQAAGLLVAHERVRIPEEKGYDHVGFHLEAGKLVWHSHRDSVILLSSEAAKREALKVCDALECEINEEKLVEKLNALKEFLDALPTDKRAQIFASMAHAITAHFSVPLRAANFNTGDQWIYGQNRTLKTPTIEVSSFFFSDGKITTLQNVKTDFRLEVLLSRPGAIFIDEGQEGKNAEILKSLMSGIRESMRGRADGTMTSSKMISIPQYATNSPPSAFDDEGQGKTARHVMWRAVPFAGTLDKDSRYSVLLSQLKSSESAPVGFWVLKEIANDLNAYGFGNFLERLRELSSQIEQTVDYSKRSETIAAMILFGEMFAITVFKKTGISLWNEDDLKFSVNEMVSEKEDNDTVQSFIDHVRETIDNYSQKTKTWDSETKTYCVGHNMIGNNGSGVYVKTKEGDLVLTIAAFQSWQKKRGTIKSCGTLDDFKRAMQNAGLVFTGAIKKYTVKNEHVHGVPTRLELGGTTGLLQVTDVLVTTSYSQVTKIYRDKIYINNSIVTSSGLDSNQIEPVPADPDLPKSNQPICLSVFFPKSPFKVTKPVFTSESVSNLAVTSSNQSKTFTSVENSNLAVTSGKEQNNGEDGEPIEPEVIKAGRRDAHA